MISVGGHAPHGDAIDRRTAALTLFWPRLLEPKRARLRPCIASQEWFQARCGCDGLRVDPFRTASCACGGNGRALVAYVQGQMTGCRPGGVCLFVCPPKELEAFLHTT